MRIAQAPLHISLLGLWLCCAGAIAQAPAEAQAPAAAQTPADQQATAVPDTPQPPPAKTLGTHPPRTPAEAAEALRISRLPVVNGRPYDQPSLHDKVADYVNDTYGWNGQARTAARALYGEIHARYFETPGANSWGTDFPGFMQRFGSAEGVTVINGNVRLGMEVLFHEDLRYIPCHGCRKRDKLKNALLAEVTARHDNNGHRFFTLTPVVADFSGPIIAHSLWYPNFDPMAGVVSSRLVFASRVGQHLFQEFVWERRHKDPPYQK
jgi:hypothetical protein